MIIITNIIAVIMLMFMVGCEKEREDSAVEDQAEEAVEEPEATMRYH